MKTEAQTITKEGKRSDSFHIYVNLPSNNQVEIVIRSPEDANQFVKCEIYRDIITGLTTQQLQQVLKETPRQKFLPT